MAARFQTHLTCVLESSQFSGSLWVWGQPNKMAVKRRACLALACHEQGCLQLVTVPSKACPQSDKALHFFHAGVVPQERMTHRLTDSQGAGPAGSRSAPVGLVRRRTAALPPQSCWPRGTCSVHFCASRNQTVLRTRGPPRSSASSQPVCSMLGSILAESPRATLLKAQVARQESYTVTVERVQPASAPWLETPGWAKAYVIGPRGLLMRKRLQISQFQQQATAQRKGLLAMNAVQSRQQQSM